MTLFANILQNPQDPRARSDVKLMNQVVNFLSLLAVTEEQGGVKRMLGVCSEFERIARVVLERGDKKGHKRRGNKMNSENQPINTNAPTPQQQQQAHSPLPHGQKRTAPPLSPPSNNNAPAPRNMFSPSAFNDSTNGQGFNPSLSDFSPSLSDIDIPLDFSGTTGGTDFQSMMTPSPNAMNSGNFDPSQFQAEGNSGSPLNMGSFQQPFVPQDLWQMPMTLEWDWSEAMQGSGAFDANGVSQGITQGQSQMGQQQMEESDGLVEEQPGLNVGGRLMM